MFPHANGQWAKKINGRTLYYGPWDDLEGALRNYHVAPGGGRGGLKNTIEKYMESRRLLEQSGEISYHHLMDIDRILKRLMKVVGTKGVDRITSEDWGRWRAELSKTNGVVSLNSCLSRMRAFLAWCVREEYLDKFPATDALKRPSRAQLRRERAKQGSKLFEPEEIHKLITSTSSEFRTMILLGVNAGLGASDIAHLHKHHLKDGWLDYPRRKTGIERRVPLWPETREALAKVIRSNDDLVFRTSYGNPWTCKSKSGSDNPISAKFTRLCRYCDVYKARRGFYSLRHTCATIGQESGDHVASEYILGHVPAANDMSATYRQRMTDERLQRVADYIRGWLFGTEPIPQLDIGLAMSVPAEVS